MLCRTSATTVTLPAASPRPTMTVAITVWRTRIAVSRSGGRLTPIRVQPVAGAADRADRSASKRDVDLPAQVSDVDFEHVRLLVEGDVPYLVEREPFGDHLSGPGHQQLEQAEL